MTKRSKRRLSRYERDQAGCISGLINVFHFRHGRSSKQLLTDRKQVGKQAEGAGRSSNNTVSPSPTSTLADPEESKATMSDACKISVKELMEEEMFNEQDLKQPNGPEMGFEQIKSKSGNRTKKNQKKKRSLAKSCDMDFNRVHEWKLSDNFDLEKILQELADTDWRNFSFLNFDVDLDVPSGEGIVVDEQLAQAVKLFKEQRLSNSKPFGEERINFCSHELREAFKTLCLNKGLFLKLIEDPNSELVTHIHNFEDARLSKRDQRAHYFPVNPKPDELVSHKHRNFFQRRTKSLESFPLGVDNNTDYQSPNKIVILKPGPAEPGSTETEIAANVKTTNASLFSFTEIRRKIRHAMGKERQGVSPERLSPNPSNGNYREKGNSFGWRSPNRNHFYMERFTLSSSSFTKGESASKLRDEGSECMRLGGSDIYIEAKKHLSEMIMEGNENTESVAGNNLVKPLGRILSLPEYNVLPCLSPKKLGDENFITAQMSLSPRGMEKRDQTVQISEGQQYVSCHNTEDKERSLHANVRNSIGDDRDCSLEMQCFNEVQPEIERTTELSAQEEEMAFDISCDSSPYSSDGDNQTGDTREVDNEKSGSPCFKSHLSVDDYVLSPPTVSPSPDRAIIEIEDLDSAIDKMEQPSPVSVLEPLFTDDNSSPASTISHSVEKEIQPRHITFEEQSSILCQGLCTRISLEDEESAFEYVEAVLLGSGLNWDEFLLRWLSSYEILDTTLFDEVELFSSRPHHDQKLLFDCANEALEEVCDCYVGCFNEISSGKPNIWPMPKGMDLIHNVWERVERCLLQKSPPLSLDGLVKSDLAGSTKWMNVRMDVEVIVCEIEEMVFDELVEEILVSFGDWFQM